MLNNQLAGNQSCPCQTFFMECKMKEKFERSEYLLDEVQNYDRYEMFRDIKEIEELLKEIENELS